MENFVGNNKKAKCLYRKLSSEPLYGILKRSKREMINTNAERGEGRRMLIAAAAIADRSRTAE